MKYNTLTKNKFAPKFIISSLLKIQQPNLNRTYSSFFSLIYFSFNLLQSLIKRTKNIPPRARAPARERYVQPH